MVVGGGYEVAEFPSTCVNDHSLSIPLCRAVCLALSYAAVYLIAYLGHAPSTGRLNAHLFGISDNGYGTFLKLAGV